MIYCAKILFTEVERFLLANYRSHLIKLSTITHIYYLNSNKYLLELIKKYILIINNFKLKKYLKIFRNTYNFPILLNLQIYLNYIQYIIENCCQFINKFIISFKFF